MKWRALLDLLDGETAFRSSLLAATGESTSTARRQLARWVATGRLQQLRRGVYAVAPPYRRRAPHPFAVARLLRPASYVSLQSALSHHGMIPEHVPVVTSVTAGRPETVETPLGRFVYRHVGRKLFRGYAAVRFGEGGTAFIATPEKALLDLVHLTPGGDELDFLHELRLQGFGSLDAAALRNLAKGSPKLRRAAVRVLKLAADD